MDSILSMEHHDNDYLYKTFPMTPKVYKYFIYSNLLVSIYAFFAVWYAYQMVNIPINIPTASIMALCVFSGYNIVLFHQYNPYNSEKFSFLHKIRKHIKRLVIISAFIACLLAGLNIHNPKQWLIIGTNIILNTWYIFPIKIKKNQITLRSIPFLKTFIIAFSWTTGTFLLPLINVQNITSEILWLGSLERFFFYFGITTIFDIRDIKTDLKAGLKTFANSLSKNNLLFICATSLFISSFFNSLINNQLLTILSILINCLILIICIQAFKKKNELFFTGILDGALLIHAFIFLISFNFLGVNT